MTTKTIIDITEKAAKEGLKLLERKGLPKGAIRIKVVAGGCSGLSYDMVPTQDPPQPDEQVVEINGLKVYLHPKSLLYLAGMTLDYEMTLMAQRFIFKNPNAKTSCSCGTSFGI